MTNINLKDSKGVDIKVGDIIAYDNCEEEWLVTPIGIYIDDIQGYGVGVFNSKGDTYRIDNSILKGVVVANIYTAYEDDILHFKIIRHSRKSRREIKE